MTVTKSVALSRIRFNHTKTAFNVFLETLNGRLPLKHSSHSRETLAKHVSDNRRHFMFSTTEMFGRQQVAPKISFLCFVCQAEDGIRVA